MRLGAYCMIQPVGHKEHRAQWAGMWDVGVGPGFHRGARDDLQRSCSPTQSRDSPHPSTDTRRSNKNEPSWLQAQGLARKRAGGLAPRYKQLPQEVCAPLSDAVMLFSAMLNQQRHPDKSTGHLGQPSLINIHEYI